jgi:hypothetical protein
VKARAEQEGEKGREQTDRSLNDSEQGRKTPCGDDTGERTAQFPRLAEVIDNRVNGQFPKNGIFTQVRLVIEADPVNLLDVPFRERRSDWYRARILQNHAPADE